MSATAISRDRASGTDTASEASARGGPVRNSLVLAVVLAGSFMAVFTGTSALCGVAPSIGVLIGARALQGSLVRVKFWWRSTLRQSTRWTGRRPRERFAG